MTLINNAANYSMFTNDIHNLFLSMFLIVTSVTLVSICTCCRNSEKESEKGEECDYGVMPNTGSKNTETESNNNNTITFRALSQTVRNSERHSQPIGNKTSTAINRQSAPGRALPQLPADLYTAIDKKRKSHDARFTDDGINAMYECIDLETDSFVDPLYSKVSEVRTGPNTCKDRRYDYPVFSRRNGSQLKSNNDDALYQSASQIFGAGSEDPYCSINSDRGRNPSLQDAEGDNSSAYDPGYAKVRPYSQCQRKNKDEKIDHTERELDLLYSKIRRHAEIDISDNQPGPSTVIDTTTADSINTIVATNMVDNQSVASREPSYRYITMRENADLVRERLRQRGELERPVREHYYSTIGNEYETINTTSAGYSRRNIPASSIAEPEDYNITPTVMVTISNSDVPAPPTSPIPGRTLSDVAIPNTTVPPPPNLRASPVPPIPIENQTESSNNLYKSNSGDHSQAHILYTSLNNKSKSCTYDESSRDGNIVAQIKEFVSRPTLPYRSLDTLIGRRIVEEKETIIEKRSSVILGLSSDEPSTSSNANKSQSNTAANPSTSSIHEVIIQRIGTSSNERNQVDGETTRKEIDESNKKEEKDSGNNIENIERHSKITKKEVNEEDKVNRLGTIYTANDYVSSIDMSNERPWPLNKELKPN